MLFINLNLNLKQSRISIKLPESKCNNKIELEINNDGRIIINSIFRFKIGSNLNKFNFNTLTLRQFNWSKVDCFYNLNFLIDCEFEYNYLINQCLINMPSDKEMALDWAYCCGNNQEIHLKNLKSSDCSFNKLSKSSESNINLNQNKQLLNNSINLDQIYFLFAKQKLFTNFLIESTNKTDYLILKILSNRCLIAFDEEHLIIDTNRLTYTNDDLIANKTNLINKDYNLINDKSIDKLTDHKEYKLREAIFVEFIYLDYNQESENVKKYRHSFENEFIQLDNELFNQFFNLLYQLNRSILSLNSKFNNLNKFYYSYIVNSCNRF